MPTQKSKSNTKPVAKDVPEYATITGIAYMLGVSNVTVARLVNDKIIPRTARGLYPLQACNIAYVNYRTRSGDTNPRKIIDEQKAAKLERENRVATKKLMPTNEALAAIDYLCLIFKTWIRAMPGRIASIAANAEPAVLREAVRVECARVVEELAKAAALNNFEAAPAEDGGDAAAHPDTGRVGKTDSGLTAKQRGARPISA